MSTLPPITSAGRLGRRFDRRLDRAGQACFSRRHPRDKGAPRPPLQGNGASALLRSSPAPA